MLFFLTMLVGNEGIGKLVHIFSQGGFVYMKNEHKPGVV